MHRARPCYVHMVLGLLQEDKYQRATLKADLRAREDELEAAKLRAGDLEREVADLKVGYHGFSCCTVSGWGPGTASKVTGVVLSFPACWRPSSGFVLVRLLTLLGLRMSPTLTRRITVG